MDSQRQKWVNLIFLLVGFIVAGVFFIATTKIAAGFNWDSRIANFDMIVRGISVSLLLLTSLGLYFYDKTNVFMNEVVLEVARVTWPTRADTTRATFLVLIMVLISGFILGGFDSLCVWALKFFL